jgi:putative ABC transport system permease protein
VFLGAPGGDATLLVETAGEPGAMAGTVRKALAAAVAPDLTVTGLITLRQQMGLALFLPRIAAGLVGTIAILGIFLAGVGLYGLVSFSVNRRAHEIGVRMAMGARPRDVLALVLRQSLWLVATGAALGLATVLLVARLVSVLLYRVSPADPLGLLASVLVVATVAVLAAHVPARRAVRVDPMMVLRRE